MEPADQGLAATQRPFTHAGIIRSQAGFAGATQVVHPLCAAEFRLLTKLEDIVLGSGMLQLPMQGLFSDTRTHSELFLHPLELYLGSSPRRRSGVFGPASSACADWRKRWHGSKGTASSGSPRLTNFRDNPCDGIGLGSPNGNPERGLAKSQDDGDRGGHRVATRRLVGLAED